MCGYPYDIFCCKLWCYTTVCFQLQSLIGVISLDVFGRFHFSFQVGTASTNALIAVRRKLDTNSVGEVENIPILQTSLAYGVYMAISSNLRYGSRDLEPHFTNLD
jgi:hypothetical protein